MGMQGNAKIAVKREINYTEIKIKIGIKDIGKKVGKRIELQD